MVRWLGAAGMDIGTGIGWIDEVDAGMERTSLHPDCYVVKNPWLFSRLDEVDRNYFDVLVLPIRDLDAAAESRVRVERRMPDREDWGYATPAGVVYPITVHDSARWLAEGFYRLLQWAVAHDVPTVLLDFPRLVNDPTYAVQRVQEAVEAGTVMQWTPDLAAALTEAHRALARPR